MPEICESTPQERFSVNLCGRDWIVERYGDLESLWNSLGEEDFDDDERLPYWTELWPSSLVLCRHLARVRDQIKDTLCLDMGCGLGLTTLVGGFLGAKPLGIDYEWPAIHYSRRNAMLNKVPNVNWMLMDWRAPSFKLGSFPVVWGADIMYERRFAIPVIACLEHVLAKGGVCWLAEPNRSVYRTFRALITGRGWSCRKIVTETISPDYGNPTPVTVNLWEVKRAGE